MVFGVNTIPSYRRKGYAGELIRRAIEDARGAGKKRTGLNLQGQAYSLLFKVWLCIEGVSGQFMAM